MYQLLFILIFALLALFGWMEYSSHSVPLKGRTEAVEFARSELPQEGRLFRKSDGFIYLKVDDNYIHKLYDLLQLKEKGFTKPPYFRSRESPGAHITLFYAQERVRPKELGKTFHFEVKNINVIKTRKGILHVVVEVNSPELEALRKKYESHKKKEQPFHITIARKKPFSIFTGTYATQ